MKSKYCVMLVGLSLFAALTWSPSFGKQRFAADGAPAPPWPKLESSLVADGATAPPWPKGDSSLMADGAPAPPWPKGSEISIQGKA